MSDRPKIDWRAHLTEEEAAVVAERECDIARGRWAARELAAVRNRAIQRAQRKSRKRIALRTKV